VAVKAPSISSWSVVEGRTNMMRVGFRPGRFSSGHDDCLFIYKYLTTDTVVWSTTLVLYCMVGIL
jgi:hypothetical protein